MHKMQVFRGRNDHDTPYTVSKYEGTSKYVKLTDEGSDILERFYSEHPRFHKRFGRFYNKRLGRLELNGIAQNDLQSVVWEGVVIGLVRYRGQCTDVQYGSPLYKHLYMSVQYLIKTLSRIDNCWHLPLEIDIGYEEIEEPDTIDPFLIQSSLDYLDHVTNHIRYKRFGKYFRPCIEMYFGLNGCEELKSVEIAKITGLDRDVVTDIVWRGLKIIRESGIFPLDNV